MLKMLLQAALIAALSGYFIACGLEIRFGPSFDRIEQKLDQSITATENHWKLLDIEFKKGEARHQQWLQEKGMK